jgi:hypothetical protein
VDVSAFRRLRVVFRMYQSPDEACKLVTASSCE